MRLPGFHFHETMAGSWTGEDGVERPMRFTAEARAQSTLQYLRDRKVRLRGDVTVDGLAIGKALDGEMTMDPIVGRIIRYEFAFVGDDGQRYRFVGQKDVTARDLVGSMTKLPGQLLALDGKRIGTVQLEFNRRDLPSFLGSWRLDLFG
jgi:hypothetical protein